MYVGQADFVMSMLELLYRVSKGVSRDIKIWYGFCQAHEGTFQEVTQPIINVLSSNSINVFT